MTPATYEIIRETWLTRKPSPDAFWNALVATAALALGSLIYLINLGDWGAKMAASGADVFVHHEYWRLWTTIFAHADLGHLASNTLLFFILGFFLNGYFGWRLFPLASFFWGGIANLIVLPSYDPETTLVGASGVVYFMGGAWLVLYFALSRQKNLAHRILRTIGVAILIFMPAETFEPNVSYRTHLAGFALGIVVGAWHFWRHRARFRAAERREWIIEAIEPGDDLPPPEGFRDPRTFPQDQ